MGDHASDFVGYGTAVEPLAEDETLSQYAAQNQLKAQKVRDKQGRERFHGAFTGGYSAGFYNTVGSKDGWTPSTFVSRNKRQDEHAERRSERPEDYMDEEDLDQFGIAPRQIKVADDYKSGKGLHRAAWDPVVPGLTKSLTDLVKPVHSSAAVKLMGLMGWKQGQGVGPRIKRKPNYQREDKPRIVGPALPPGYQKDVEDDSDDDEYIRDITFAPNDVNPINFDIKDNLHGIGYQALKVDQNITSSKTEEERLMFGGHSKGISGKAFGVGIEEDEDDDDIYRTEKISNYDRIITDEPDNYHQYTRPKGGGRQRLFQSSGRVLDGFCLAQKSDKPADKYRAPDVPKGYRPKAIITGASQLPKLYGKLDKTIRSLIIGELPQVSTSNTDTKQDDPMLPGKSDAINLNISAAKVDDVDKDEDNDPLPPPRSSDPLNKRAVDFKPFIKDPEKQSRYEKYLTLVKTGTRDAYHKVAPPQFTRHEKEREKEEFERSGKFFRDLTGVMASRFTRSKAADDDDDDNKVRVRVDEESTGLLDDKKHAVKMKLFGKLTRESYEWHPHRLLCKRFNIADPYPDSQLVGLPVVTKDKISAYNFLDIESLTKTPEEKKVLNDANQAQKGSQSADILVSETKSLSMGEKAPADLFKAVFQDTESESESSDNEETDEQQTTSKSAPSKEQTSLAKASTAASAPKVQLESLQERYSQSRGMAVMYETEKQAELTETPTEEKVLFVPRKDRLKTKKVKKSRWNDEDELAEAKHEENDQQPAPTLQDPTNTLQGPTNTLQGPTNTLQEPVVTLQDPTNTLQGPTNTLQEPIATLQEPVTTLQEPPDSITTVEVDDNLQKDSENRNEAGKLEGEADDEDLWMPALPPSLLGDKKQSAETESFSKQSDYSVHKKSKHKNPKDKHKKKSKKSHKEHRHHR